MQLKHVSFSSEFTRNRVNGIWHLVIGKDSKKVASLTLVLIKDRHGNGEWANWEEEVQVLPKI